MYKKPKDRKRAIDEEKTNTIERTMNCEKTITHKQANNDKKPKDSERSQKR